MTVLFINITFKEEKRQTIPVLAVLGKVNQQEVLHKFVNTCDKPIMIISDFLLYRYTLLYLILIFHFSKNSMFGLKTRVNKEPV